MKSLHISLNTAHSRCKPSTSMSSSTHSFQVYLFLLHLTHPCHLHLSTCRHPIIHTLRSRCPNHLKSATPRHIHHLLYTQKTVQIHTAFSILQRHPTSISPSSTPSSPDYADFLSSSPRFQSHMSTHSGHKPFPFMWYDAPRAVGIGDNSLNLAKAHLTLALSASSTPPLKAIISYVSYILIKSWIFVEYVHKSV